MTGGATHESLDKTEVILPPSERSFGYTFAWSFRCWQPLRGGIAA